MRLSSVGGSSRWSSHSRSIRFQDEETGSIDYAISGSMLPDFLDNLNRPSNFNSNDELVELELEVQDGNVNFLSVTPRVATPRSARGDDGASISGGGSDGGGGLLSISMSAASKFRNKFRWSSSSKASSDAGEHQNNTTTVSSKREYMKEKFKLHRTGSGAQRALQGLRFISKTTVRVGDDVVDLWGMTDSKEFAAGIFDALARRKRQRICKINKEELHDFWVQLSDQSFDARLQIFFDMVDRNEDGRITREEVQEVFSISYFLFKFAPTFFNNLVVYNCSTEKVRSKR
ncbi:hypothetical protein KSS87_006886, partial [Heliosperma pusillum]